MSDGPMTISAEKAYAALVQTEEVIAATLGKARKDKLRCPKLGSAKEVIAWGKEMGWMGR